MQKKFLGIMVAGAMMLSGCVAQLSDADRALLNQAVESGKASSQTLQAAEAAASQAEQSALKAESAATRAELAAGQAQLAAGQAQQDALKAEKAFEMKIKK